MGTNILKYTNTLAFLVLQDQVMEINFQNQEAHKIGA